MPSGFIELEVMTEADINEVRDKFGQTHSRDGKPLPWTTSWGEMARKTVLRRLRKRLPQSAVDQLLDREPEVDVDALMQPVKDELSSVRELALRAAGAIPASTSTPEQSGAAPLAEG
jgi:recombinational DNA repair protein RecT